MNDAAKIHLDDGSVEFVPVEDIETLKLIVGKHTERVLTGSVSFLDDVQFKCASGRTVTLKEIRSVEE